MLSHSVRRNLPKLLAAPQSGLFLLRLGPGGSGGLPERTARLGTLAMSSETCLAPREAGIFLPRCFPCASQSRLWDDSVRSAVVMAGASKPIPSWKEEGPDQLRGWCGWRQVVFGFPEILIGKRMGSRSAEWAQPRLRRL